MQLAPAQHAAGQLRIAVAHQLDDVADGLTLDQMPSHEEWESRQTSFEPMLWTLRETPHRMLEARRGNVRARRYHEATVRQERHAQALLRIVDLVEDLTSVIGQEEGAEDSKLGLGPGLRPGVERVTRAG